MNAYLRPLVLVICATSTMAQEVVLRPITATNTMAQKVVTTNTDNLQKSTNLIQNAAGYVMDDKHQLEPGDKISFQITEDKKPLINLVVTDSSEVEVPYVGRVSVAKKNCRQLAAELKAMLEKDYYYRATVIVGLDSVNKVRGQIYISGMVRSQGSMDILFNQVLTAGEAILLAGGFSSFADEKMVKVIRHSGNGDSMQKVIEVNMVDVLEKGKIEEDVILEPGDFIIVPAKILNF